jgi:hypothetical protein
MATPFQPAVKSLWISPTFDNHTETETVREIIAASLGRGAKAFAIALTFASDHFEERVKQPRSGELFTLSPMTCRDSIPRSLPSSVSFTCARDGSGNRSHDAWPPSRLS